MQLKYKNIPLVNTRKEYWKSQKIQKERAQLDLQSAQRAPSAEEMEKLFEVDFGSGAPTKWS